GFHRPGFLVANEGPHVIDRLAKTPPVRTLITEQIVARRRENLTDGSHCFKIKKRIPVRLSPAKFFRKAAVLRNLIRHNHGFESLTTEVEQLLIANQV